MIDRGGGGQLRKRAEQLGGDGLGVAVLALPVRKAERVVAGRRRHAAAASVGVCVAALSTALFTASGLVFLRHSGSQWGDPPGIFRKCSFQRRCRRTLLQVHIPKGLQSKLTVHS